MSIHFGTAILFFYYVLCIFLQRLTVADDCHREGQFTKVKPDGLPQINPIKITTATEGTFCSIKCLDYPGCSSFAYLNYTSSENCLLSSSVDGASVTGASGVVEIYKKTEHVAKGCQPNPCLNGGTCQNTCVEPYYFCVCPEETTGEACTRIFKPFYAKFTTLGQYGRLGPTTIGNHYDGQSHKDFTTLQNGIQHFTVPYTGTYTITAVGATGGLDKSNSAYRGRGTRMGGDFNLVKGQVLKILVGQSALYNGPYSSAGGGGGSFVATSSNTPLIVAGGGGGIESVTKEYSNAHGSTGTVGKSNAGSSSIWNGGSGGNGATEADSSNSGGGGGGFYSNGRSATNFGGQIGTGGEGGYGFIQGGQGGRSKIQNGEGGFGGGAGAYGNGGGAGGGGGYSGGASGDNYVDSCAGGGGSFNAAFQNKFYSHGYNSGYGYVTINRIH